MGDLGPFSDIFLGSAGLFAAIVLLALFLLPARVVAKRHGYPSWIIVFAIIPYLGPYIFLWALATSEAKHVNGGAK